MSTWRKILLGVLTLGVVLGVASWLMRGRIAVAAMGKVYAHAMSSNPLAELPDGLHAGLCGSGSPMPDPTRAGPCVAVVAGRKLFAAECEFFFAAQRLDQLPPPGLPEIAFAGRSNVGKSSLVNALTGRNTLARTSAQPGRTKQLNFFNLGDRLVLVDMPGYGYAQAAKSVKEDWQGK